MLQQPAAGACRPDLHAAAAIRPEIRPSSVQVCHAATLLQALFAVRITLLRTQQTLIFVLVRALLSPGKLLHPLVGWLPWFWSLLCDKCCTRISLAPNILIGTTQGMAAAGQRCRDGGKAAGVTPQEDAQHVSPAQHAQPVQGKPEMLPCSDVLDATVIWGCSLQQMAYARHIARPYA